MLANSVVDMQKMLDVCFSEMQEIGMSFNVNKSVAIRYGHRFKLSCANLTLDGNIIKYSDKIKYPGVVFKAGKRIECSYEHIKLTYYKAFNALYANSKAADSELISVQLMKSFCLPIIMYAVEVTYPNDKAFDMFDKLIDNSIRKIFNVVSNDNVKDCRVMLGLHPIRLLCQLRNYKFMMSLNAKLYGFKDIVSDLSFIETASVLDKLNIPDVRDRRERLKIAIYIGELCLDHCD